MEVVGSDGDALPILSVHSNSVCQRRQLLWAYQQITEGRKRPHSEKTITGPRATIVISKLKIQTQVKYSASLNLGIQEVIIVRIYLDVFKYEPIMSADLKAGLCTDPTHAHSVITVQLNKRGVTHKTARTTVSTVCEL